MAAHFILDWLRPALDRCRDLTEHRHSAKSWTKSTTDGGTELVTEIDLAVESVLTEAIHDHLPDAAILSEESNPDPSALASDTCFVIDPIDGTNELAAGRPGFAISIALFRNGRPAAALLDLPAHDRRFHCAAGGGAYLNDTCVELSPTTSLRHARLAVSATQYEMDVLRTFWESVDAASLIPTPAFAAKFAAVLAGDCDAAIYLPVRPHRTAIWDYAAAALVLAEAGGWFGSANGTNLLQRQPFVYSDGWVASPPALRDELLGVAQRAPEQPRPHQV
jgi:myo-inositol-1(or 4)-monophosphatase